MRVLGLGQDGFHRPWSKNGYAYTPDELALHLKEYIIKTHAKWMVPEMPPVDLPIYKALPVPGTLSPDIIRLDTTKAEEEKMLIDAVEGLMKELERKGFGDRYADMQTKISAKGGRLSCECKVGGALRIF